MYVKFIIVYLLFMYRMNMLTKDYNLNYKMNQKHNLFKHIGGMNGRYFDIDHKDIKLTEKEKIYGLLKSLSDYWDPIIFNLV